MPRNKRSTDTPVELQAKGLACAIGGLIVLFVKLPIFGTAFRPFGWILIVVGGCMFTLPTLIAFLKAEADKQKDIGLGHPEKPNPFSSGSNNQASSSFKKPKEFFGRSKKSAAGLDTKFGRERVEPVLDTRTPASTWSDQVFKDIEWRRFESVCELLFCQAGFTAKTQSHGADGGVDIWLYSSHSQGPAAIVQCKHWRNRPVGVKELREFFGVMASNKIARGTYATSSVFTTDAMVFAKANGINAMDGNRLLLQIAQRSTEQQEALLKTAYEGDYWRPTCASCGIKMLERGKTEKRFWGCANYPKCRNTITHSA